MVDWFDGRYWWGCHRARFGGEYHRAQPLGIVYISKEQNIASLPKDLIA
jgi:hypothetical protein